MDFEINLIFLIEPFFLHDQISSWEQKELLRWNKKHFWSFLKGFQLSKIETLEWAFNTCCILQVSS